MSKKEKSAPQEEREKDTCPEEPAEVTEEYRQEDAAETYTVTREPMEKMEFIRPMEKPVVTSSLTSFLL